MFRVLTILAAIAALAVTAGPAAAYSLSSGGDRPTESLSYTKAPPKPPRATLQGGEILPDFAKSKPKPLSLNTFGGNDT